MTHEDLQASFGRCLVKDGFLDRFYELFTSSDPSIGPMFAGTDMAKQKGLLRTGLTMLLMYAKGTNSLANATVERLGRSHNKQGLNINPSLYPYWKQSLLQAVKEFDRDFSPELATQWSDALQIGIDRMIALYEDAQAA